MVDFSRRRVLQSVPVVAVAVALPTGLRRTAFDTTLLHLLPGPGGSSWKNVVNPL